MKSYLAKLPVVAATVTAAVLLVALLPPFLPEDVARVVMAAYSSVCHQIAERSPAIESVQLAACHRCFGIYAGLTAGALLFPLLMRWSDVLMRRAGFFILGALAVPGIDWAGDVAGLWTNSPVSRVLTGAVFGFMAGFYFSKAVAEILTQRNRTTVADQA